MTKQKRASKDDEFNLAITRIIKAANYTLGHLLDDKYIKDDVLWSCVTQLTSSFHLLNKLVKGKKK